LIFLSYYFQSGPNNATGESVGVNYRALNDLFNISASRQSSIVYEIGVQIIEIYNEQVRDLLSTDTAVKKYPFCFSVDTYSLIMSIKFLSEFGFPTIRGYSCIHAVRTLVAVTSRFDSPKKFIF
jgi:hypothetical protein